VGQAFGDVLPLAVAIAIFPVPIITTVLILGSARGQVKTLAFVLAWFAGLTTVGAIVLALTGVAHGSDGGEPATWTAVLLLALGVLLLVLAVRQWRSRPRAGQETPMPTWMRTLDDFTVAKAGGAGIALSALNPKNVLLVVAAAAEIDAVGIPAGRQVVVLLAFVVVASAGVLAPLVLSVAFGNRSRAWLDALRGWLTRHNAAIMSVLFLVIGAKLVGDALAGFSS